MEIKRENQEHFESNLAQVIGAVTVVGVVLLAPLASIFWVFDKITKSILWLFRKL